MKEKKFETRSRDDNTLKQDQREEEGKELPPEIGERIVVAGSEVISRDPRDQVLIEHGFLPRKGVWPRDKIFAYTALPHDRRPFELMARWTGKKVVYRQNEKGEIVYYIMSDEDLKKQQTYKEVPYGSDKPS